MKNALLTFLILLLFGSSYAQSPLTFISDFFQQSPRFSTGFVIGIIIMVVAKSALSGFFQNEQDRNRIAVALGVGTIILFQFAVPEYVTTSVSNFAVWGILGAIGIVILSLFMGKFGGGVGISIKAKIMTIGIILILISLLLGFIGVDI